MSLSSQSDSSHGFSPIHSDRSDSEYNTDNDSNSSINTSDIHSLYGTNSSSIISSSSFIDDDSTTSTTSSDDNSSISSFEIQ
eukprot:UN10349